MMKDNIDYKDIPIPEMISVKNKTEAAGGSLRAKKNRSNTSLVKLYKSEYKTILEGKKDIFVFTDPKSTASKLNLTQITSSLFSSSFSMKLRTVDFPAPHTP